MKMAQGFRTKLFDTNGGVGQEIPHINVNTPEVSAEEKPLIHVVHDECTYYADSNQSFWEDGPTNLLVHPSWSLSLSMRCLVMSEMSRVRLETN